MWHLWIEQKNSSEKKTQITQVSFSFLDKVGNSTESEGSTLTIGCSSEITMINGIVRIMRYHRRC